MKEILSYICKQKHLLPRDDTNTSVLIHIARATEEIESGDQWKDSNGTQQALCPNLCAQSCKYLPVLLKNINRIICKRATCYYGVQAVLVVQYSRDKGYK